MREIKFRAWLKEEKKMVAVKSIDFNELGYPCTIFIENVYGKPKAFSISNTLGKINVELLEYTGLKDSSKPPKEIYEGDIVKINMQSPIDSEPYYKTFVIKDLPNFFSGTYFDGLVGWGHDEPEVIGNVWEHKEMLNE